MYYDLYELRSKAFSLNIFSCRLRPNNNIWIEVEINVLKALDHPHIIRLHEFFEDYNNVFFFQTIAWLIGRYISILVYDQLLLCLSSNDQDLFR